MWHLPPDQLRIIEELEKGSDRASAIVAAALVETAIFDLISDRLKRSDSPDERTPRKELLGTDRPLGSVSSRCNLAFLLGIISYDALFDLKNVSEIRNKFAHNASVDTFETSSIKDKCRNFRLIRCDGRVHEVSSTMEINEQSFSVQSWAVLTDTTKPPFISIGIENAKQKLERPRDQYMISCRILLTALHFYKSSYLRDEHNTSSQVVI